MAAAACTSLSRPCFWCSCPGWWLCCFPWTSWPGWPASLCSVWNCGTKPKSNCSVGTLPSSGPLWPRSRDGSPLLDELELHGLLLLHAGQQLLEVFALLRDVVVLHLLLLVAVAADQLWPLFSVLCSDVLYLGGTRQQNAQADLQENTSDSSDKCRADKEEAGFRFLRHLGFVVGNQWLDLILRFLL